MAVSRQDPPEETRQALLAGIEDFLGKESPLARGIRDRSLHTEPLPVFTLALQAILGNEGIDAVQPAGWRFVTEMTGEVVASDVMDVSAEIGQRMTGLSRDRRLAGVIRFIREIPDLPQVQGGADYELSLLRIPGILVDAFWLKSKAGAGDLIIPVLSSAEDLPRRVYEAAEFFSIARPVAERFKEFDRRRESAL